MKHTFKAGCLYEVAVLNDLSAPAQAIFRHARKKITDHHIDLEDVAAAEHITRADLLYKLLEFNDAGIIDLKSQGVVNVYKVLKPLPSSDDEIEVLVTSIHKHMSDREKEALDRTDQVLQLVYGKECFTRALALHFGDEFLGGKKNCGHCTWCLTRKAVPRVEPPIIPFSETRFNNVLTRVKARDDPRFLTRLAFGIPSPRIRFEKLDDVKLKEHPLFESMMDHPFMVSKIWLSLTISLAICESNNTLGAPRGIHRRM